MSDTLSQKQSHMALIERISRLEETVAEMRANQSQKLVFGNMTIDGTGTGVIQNSSGSTVVDATGLNSTSNFNAINVHSNTQHTTTSTSFVDIPGSTLTSFTLSRNTVVYIFFNVWGQINTFNTDGSYIQVELVDSLSGNITNVDVVGQWSTNYRTDQIAEHSFITTLGSGTHTLKLQFKVVGTGTATIDDFTLGYIVLGS